MSQGALAHLELWNGGSESDRHTTLTIIHDVVREDSYIFVNR